MSVLTGSRAALDAAQKQASKWRYALSALGAGVLVGAVATYFLFGRSSPAPDLFPRGHEPPVEFLYLDSARVGPYLSQLENGLSNSAERTLNLTYGTSGSVKAGAAEAGGTRQAESSLKETVTATAASLFYRLETELKDGRWLKQLDVDSRTFGQSIAQAREGGFVRIENCRLVLPSFARVYPLVEKRLPPLPLSLRVDSPEGDIDLLFPISYTSLANESSLFSTNLTVVGKVIRQVRLSTVRVDRGKGYLQKATNPYVDVDSYQSFKQILASRGRRLRLLGLDVKVLERQFKAATTVRPPGTVILPIAIFT